MTQLLVSASEPIFAVRDITATLDYYARVLGGRGRWDWGEEPSFGGISLGKAQVMFQLQPDLAQHVAGHEHYFRTDDVDTLHAQHQAAGAEVIGPIGDRPWGLREYVVRDLNGYHLRFGGTPVHVKPLDASQSLPDYIRIERRLASFAEYDRLHQAVGWGPPKLTEAQLAASLGGVVAVDERTGQVVGMARVLQDADTWFSIWDVIVDPDHQQRQVGRTVLQELLALTREHAVHGGSAYLFTFRPGFYEKLGFQEAPCMKFTF